MKAAERIRSSDRCVTTEVHEGEAAVDALTKSAERRRVGQALSGRS